MKTSKIKRIESVKEWGEGDRRTLYHSVEMENGDKINIGKKKTMNMGDELNYEIVDTGQEYNKAKSVTPDYDNQTSLRPPNTPKSQDNVQDHILFSVCLKEVNLYVCQHGTSDLLPLEPNAGNPLDVIAEAAFVLAKSCKEKISQL